MLVHYSENLLEKEILKGCAKNDSRCQKSLYDAFSAKMFGICLRYAKNYHTAEDYLQEGFIRVFKNIHTFRSEGSLEGWIRRIIVNTALEHLRQAVHIHAIDEINGIEYLNPINGIEDDLDEMELLKLVRELSDGYRTVFNLYVIEGYSHQEIANMLGISIGTSKSQLARARVILQKKVIAAQQIPIYESRIQP